MTDEVQQKTMFLLTQLLESTQRLSESAEDPEADIEALSRSCQEQLAELQEILRLHSEGSGRTLATENPEAAGLLKALHAQTLQCMEDLRNSRDRIGEEIAALRQTRRAIRAYES